MSTQRQAQRVVLGAAAGTAAVSIAADLTDGNVPNLGIVLGAAGVAIGLSIVSEIAPDLATSFAVLIFVAALLAAGPETYKRLRKVLANA